MKSERRHELETNQLASSMSNLPVLMRLYGSRILLAVVLIILVVVFIFSRINASRTAAAQAADALAFSRERLASLRQFEPLALPAPEDRRTTFRQYVQEISDALDLVVQNVEDPHLLAEALIVRGDLNWLIATYPELPEATTRPALRLQEDREGPLAIAQQSYHDVLTNYVDQEMAALSAHMGLAAIAENRGDWDTAREHYQAVADNDRFTEAFREQARRRIENLDDVRQPVLIVDRSLPNTDSPATTQPATQPAATQPATN